MSNSKSKHRFYVPPQNVSGNIILITQPEYHHIVDVVRCKQGDSICIFNGKGNEYVGNIISIDRNAKNIKVKIEKVYKPSPCVQGLGKENTLARPLILVQSLVKGAKMDFIVQKATEMGVTHIFPVRTRYSVVRLNSGKEDVKIKKWKRITQEASKQSGRRQLPVLDRIWNLDEALTVLDWVDTKIICALQEKSINLKDISNKKSESIAVAVGPEGGFTGEEVELARSKGWMPVRLGGNILRTETAAIVVLGILCYKYDYILS